MPLAGLVAPLQPAVEDLPLSLAVDLNRYEGVSLGEALEPRDVVLPAEIRLGDQ